MTVGGKGHWDTFYETRNHTDVSWYQSQPTKSLELIESTGVSSDAALIDMGGGASTLVDHLVDRRFSDLTVLDISPLGMRQAQDRLGSRAGQVSWVVADIRNFEPQREYSLWHDRALLHFLTARPDRDHYISALKRALVRGGYLVLATFGPDGPLKCSGLEVRRYSVETTRQLLGAGFDLCSQELCEHETPTGETQQLLYTVWKRVGDE